jgi:U-box domain
MYWLGRIFWPSDSLAHSDQLCRNDALTTLETADHTMLSVHEKTTDSAMEVPTEFVCPITMEIMIHPVATRYGQNFERSAIVAWLDKGSGECPLTRRPLRMRDLINNNHLTKKIRQWKELHDLTQNDDDEESNGVEQVPEEDEVLILMYGTAANRLKPPAATKTATATTQPTAVPSMALAHSLLLARKAAVARSRQRVVSLPRMAEQGEGRNRAHQHMWFY